MTAPGNGRRRTLADAARAVVVLSVVLGVVLAGFTVWALVQVVGQDSGADDRVPLVQGRAVVTMDEGRGRTVYVDGPSLGSATCTVTAPDGSITTLDGFDPVGPARLGVRPLGEVVATQTGEHVVGCTGVQQASVGPQTTGADDLLGPAVVAGLFLVVGVVPIGVVAAVVARRARRP